MAFQEIKIAKHEKSTRDDGACCESDKTTDDSCCSSAEVIAASHNDRATPSRPLSAPGAQSRFIPRSEYPPVIISFVLLTTGIIADNFLQLPFFNGVSRVIWYVAAYIPVGWPVIKKGITAISRGNIFTEFFLMGIATIGAFAIGLFSEGVAVMLFYAVGELFQGAAVRKAKGNIKALLDGRPDITSVIRNGNLVSASPAAVQVGEIIQLKPGEKVALDGELTSEKAAFNTSALTGESKPDNKYAGEKVLAGMINLNTVAEVKVTTLFKDSKLSRILEMVQDAAARKSKTQLFVARFAKIYTPIVVFLAVALCLLPWLFVEHYVFREWLYRALIFLVISCPCALVISIPLGYFGGIGLASRNGILFKGSNFIDIMTKVNTVVMDKTGTLTKGIFTVQQVVSNGMDKNLLVGLTSALESKSTHPVAGAITDYAKDGFQNLPVENVEEIPGCGLRGKVDGHLVVAGNAKLFQKFNILYDSSVGQVAGTCVLVAVDGRYAGYFIIADEVRDDAQKTISGLRALHIETVMLSGDKTGVVNDVAKRLGIDEGYGDLLPEEKVAKVQALKNNKRIIAFAGDGVNDAPVIALADAGIAMGGLGADAAIETADIVIQNDQPSKIVSAIKIGRLTRSIVWQNIILAMAVKVIVLSLGAGGVATLWEAVFADVGVALLAILNAVRLQRSHI